MALRDQPYLPLYIKDFLTNTKLIECSAQSTGVYIRLMCIMHKSEEYGKILLKQKDKQSSNQIQNFVYKLVKQFPYSEKILFDSFTELIDEKVIYIDGDYLCQKRMVKDNDISIKRASAGKKGGGNPNFVNKLVKTKKQTNTVIENEDEIVNENKIEFNVFWNAYDKKVDLKKCEGKWNKLNLETQNKILEFIPKYKLAYPDKTYRKDPSTFLNNESWNNEIQIKTNQNQSTGKPSPLEEYKRMKPYEDQLIKEMFHGKQDN